VSFCEEAADWASGLTTEAIPPRVVERARLQAENMAAARAAGAEEAELVAPAAPEGTIGEIYRNAAASIAHDWDDYLFMGHTGHSSVWAARAFESDADRALIAQIAANEVAGRLGAALLLGPHNGQFWSTIHCAGAAVAAGLGLQLGAEALAHAIAIALYQPPYGLWPGFMGPSSKLLTAAEPATAGARAALLASAGMVGALDIVENPRGLLTHLAFAPRPAMLGGLGRVWLTDTLAYKARPGCAYLQAAADAALAAEVKAPEVQSIEVEAGYLTCAMERLGAGEALTPVRVNFSTALSVAICVLAGRLTHEELRREWLADRERELREIAARVSVRHAWELTARTLRGPLEAGATLRDLSLADWFRIARRARELHMDEAGLGRAELLDLIRDETRRREFRELLGRAWRAGGGIEGLDTGAMRLEFPSRLRIRLRCGAMLEFEGRDRGACGRPLEEQRGVVDAKAALVGAAATGETG
jgi:2-methylcitrate dehydratase PrpD